MAITQKFDLEGGLRSSDAAANASLAASHEAQRQRAAQDAKLKELLTGQRMKEESVAANAARARQQAKETGMQPGRYSIQASEGGFSVNPESDPLGKQIAQGLRQANITGYDVTDPNTVIPSPKDAEEVKKATGSLKALQGTGVDVQSKLGSAGALDRFGAVRIPFTEKRLGTEKGIAIDAGLTDMMLQLKELANLGAITGPDKELMDSAMGNVTGLGALIGGKERGIAQLNEVLKRAKSKVETGATSRGYTPKQGYLEAPGAAARPPSFEEWKAMKARGGK